MGASVSVVRADHWEAEDANILPIDVGRLVRLNVLKVKDDAALGTMLQSALKTHGLQIIRQKELKGVQHYMDSIYVKGWLGVKEATKLFHVLREMGEHQRPKTSVNQNDTKYPLWTLYYGLRRSKDGAMALDRWGSYHESWTRVEEPCELLKETALKLGRELGLQDEALNSFVVNYYFDGASTYIPAHRDTVSCLQDGSRVYCLSLGATRSFLLVNNEDCGKFEQRDMTVVQEWEVGHGDMFGLGQETNTKYCHAIPRDQRVQDLRISIIFRSVDKSFVDLQAKTINVKYANGNVKPFSAEVITTKDIHDAGTREHIAWLVADREEDKARKGLEKKLKEERDQQYFMGEGLAVPKSNVFPKQ